MKSDFYPEALIIDPMKINKIPEGKEHLFPSLCSSGEYFAEVKKDGYWYMYEKTANHAYLFSRNTSVETGTLAEKSANVPHIMEALSCLPAGTILIGEIYYPGGTSKSVTPIMGSLPEKAIERQKGEYGYLHYYIHDILRYNNVDLVHYGASIRYDILKLVVEKYCLISQGTFTDSSFVLDHHNQPLAEFNKIINFIELAERVDDNIQETVAEVLAAGEEGMVLKKRSAPYTPGKRPAWDTLKIKKTDTCDAICIGTCDPTVEYNGKLDVGNNYTGKDASSWPYWAVFKDGIFQAMVPQDNGNWTVDGEDYQTRPVTKAFYYGWKTAIEIGAYDETGKIVSIGTISSGLTDEMREGLAKYPSLYVGKVVELAGMEKNNEDHTLRHFHLLRFRDDKDPKDCTIKNIF